MITLLFIFLIIFVIVKIINPADKKSEKQKAKDDQALTELPDICLKGKSLGKWEKALNLCPKDKETLDVFEYRRSDRSITIKVKNGDTISCPLEQLDVNFEKVVGMYGMYEFKVSHEKRKIKFYNFDNVFSKKEYDVIIGVLWLAGTTHNREIMGSTYKNMSRAATVIKILSKL